MIRTDPRVDPHLVPEGSRPYVLNNAKRQYHDLPAIVTPNGIVITRWAPTAEERDALLRGEDVFVTVFISSTSMSPFMVTVGPVDWNEL